MKTELTFKTYARVALKSDIKQMLELDEIAFKKTVKYRQSEEFLSDWIKRSPGNVFVLLNNDKICGRADCLPVRSVLIERLKKNRCPLDNALISKFLLPLDEAKEQALGSGNILFCGMVVINPLTNAEDYGRIAGPLFDKFGEKFQELHMTAVVGRSHTKDAEQVWRNRAGGVELSRKGPSIVWFCDENTANASGGAGLPTVIKINQSRNLQSNPADRKKHAEFLKSLTEREREILTNMINGITLEKALAEKFGRSPNTIHTHIRHMLSKAHGTVGNVNTKALLAFCAQFNLR